MVNKIISINDSLHGLIEVSEMEKQIISNNLFNRLHDVYQDSTVYLTFPTDRTKRFEHSIGAMYLAGEMFSHALSNADGLAYEMLVQDANKSMENILNNIFQNNESSQDKFLKDIFYPKQKWEESVETGLEEGCPIDGNILARVLSAVTKADTMQGMHIDRKMTYEMTPKTRVVNLAVIYQAVRIAALLHDVGHLPFSHITERALGELYLKYKDDKNNPLVQAYDECKRDSIHGQLHEMIGDKIINIIFEEVIEKLYLQKSNITLNELKKVNELKRIYFYIVWICVMLILTNGKFNEDYYSPNPNYAFWTTLHSLIDGEIDCDRLDYIVRDGTACGIVGTQIDYKRIISGLKLSIKKERGENKDTYCFAFLAKSLNSIENFYLKRYNLYQNAIYHHRVIKTDTLLQKAIVELVDEYFASNSEEEKKTEALIFPTDNIRGLWTALKRINSRHAESISNLIQWNDSWLMTVLKNEWYIRKANKQPQKGTEDLTDKLDEILTNEKYYFSAVKREYDFALIDEEFRKTISDKLSCFNKIVPLLENKQSTKLKEQLSPLEQMNQFIAVFKNGQWSFLHTRQKFFLLNLFDNLVWSNISDEICKDRPASVLLENIISECAIQAKKEFNTIRGDAIADVIIGLKKNKGINAARVNLYRPFYSTDKKEQVFTLNNTSNIQNVIDLFRLYSPLFYVYIKKTKNAPNQIDANGYLQILGKKLGDCFVNIITELGDKFKAAKDE